MTHCPPSSRMRSRTTESRHSIFPRSLTCSAEFICYSRGKTLHMIKRPLAISIIGCYLVCKGVLLLFLTSFSLKDPATMEAMAKYTTWTAIGSVVSFLTVPTRAALVPGILIFLVVVFFLFSEKANHFFKRVSANLMLPNTPLEPTAEKRGGSEAESLCVRPILRRSCEWS